MWQLSPIGRSCGGLRCASTAAQRVHDFNHIPLAQQMFGMPSTRHDFAIDLYRNAAPYQVFLLQQGGQRQVVGKRAWGAVELNVHGIIVASRAVFGARFVLRDDVA